jgi:hypothetical protein
MPYASTPCARLSSKYPCGHSMPYAYVPYPDLPFAGADSTNPTASNRRCCPRGGASQRAGGATLRTRRRRRQPTWIHGAKRGRGMSKGGEGRGRVMRGRQARVTRGEGGAMRHACGLRRGVYDHQGWEVRL